MTNEYPSLISIPLIGEFAKHHWDSDSFYYECKRLIRENETRYVFYKEGISLPITEWNIRKISKAFSFFDNEISQGLFKLPKVLRKYVKETYISIDHLTDEDIIKIIADPNKYGAEIFQRGGEAVGKQIATTKGCLESSGGGP